MSRVARCLVWSVLSLAPSLALAQEPAKPEAPRQRVDTEVPRVTGKTLAVGKDGDFQAALDAARPGDVIVLEAGAVYAGPFTLPAKTGPGWIVIRSNAKGLPAPGTRVDPSHARLMPKLVARSAPALSTAPGAHHYRLVGLEIHPGDKGLPTLGRLRHAARLWRSGMNAAAAASLLTDLTLVQLGAGRQASGQVPHHIIIDRCYLHGDVEAGARRGIALNASHAAVIDSYLADFKAVGVDSQAILGWNGPGPFKLVNNYLEGAGENVMFGGGTPSIADLVPSDIEIRHNHFAKPLSWKRDQPGHEVPEWTVKNLFELKNARRVWVEGNLFEHSWPQAQDGFAMLLTVRTEDDAVPWAVVEDVTLFGNVIRRCASGINIMGIDDGSARGDGRARRIAIRNNLFEDIGGARWGERSRLFQLLDGTEHVAIEHNTALHAGTIVFGERAPHRAFVFADNIVVHNEYGFIGSGSGVGWPTLQRYFPDAVVRRNVIVGGAPAAYPRGNFFPATLAEVGFTDLARGDYRLGRAARFARVGSGGNPVGADIEALRQALGDTWPG
jgi:hypothetical protein